MRIYMKQETVNELSERRISGLKKKSFIELSQLEDYQGEKVTQNGKSCTVAVWKDAISDDELRIVIQIYRYWFLGIGKMDADGFKIDSEGKISDLTKEELYDFI